MKQGPPGPFDDTMRIQPFTLGRYGTDCYIAYGDGRCTVIDAPYPMDAAIAFLKDSHLIPDDILLTHGHFDHIFGLAGMKAAFPDDRERLDHILEHQVFGIAPTKIIYEIATHFILGFHDEVGQGCDSNFELADAAELAKEGTLEAYVERVFGPKLGEA